MLQGSNNYSGVYIAFGRNTPAASQQRSSTDAGTLQTPSTQSSFASGPQ